MCTVIQEVFPEGAVAHDGRLMAGDQILEVSGFATIMIDVFVLILNPSMYFSLH